MSEQAAPFSVGDAIAGRFEVVRTVRETVLGWLFLCLDHELDVDVGVQVLSQRIVQTDADRTRIRQRLRELQRLNVPGLARIYDEGEDAGTAFFSMPPSEGETLGARLRARAIDPELLCATLESVGLALEGADGIAHGGLTPENIILTNEGPLLVGAGLVAGLGRAPVMLAYRTAGLQRFLPPEFLRGESLGLAGDVFSLGVIAQEALGPELSLPVAAVLRQATATDAEARFATAKAFVQTLTTELFDSPIDLDDDEFEEITDADESPLSPTLGTFSTITGDPASASGESDDGSGEGEDGTAANAMTLPEGASDDADAVEVSAVFEPPPPVAMPRPVERLVPEPIPSRVVAERQAVAWAGDSDRAARERRPSRAPLVVAALLVVGIASAFIFIARTDVVGSDPAPSSSLAHRQSPPETTPEEPAMLEPEADPETSAESTAELNAQATAEAKASTEGDDQARDDQATDERASAAKATEPRATLDAPPADDPARARVAEGGSAAPGPEFGLPVRRASEPAAQEQPQQQAVEKRRMEDEARRKQEEALARLAAVEALKQPEVPAPKPLSDAERRAQAIASLTAPETKPAVDVVPSCPRGMLLIRAGGFMLGASATDDLRNMSDLQESRASTEDYCIDVYEYPNRRGAKPASNVSFTQAQASCRAGKKRLCTEGEWERACKGPRNARFPYGADFDAEACNTRDAGGSARSLVSAGTFAKCASGYGVRDLAGNVAEWVDAGTDAERIVKGGAANRPGFATRCAARESRQAASPHELLGFRCCADPR